MITPDPLDSYFRGETEPERAPRGRSTQLRARTEPASAIYNAALIWGGVAFLLGAVLLFGLNFGMLGEEHILAANANDDIADGRLNGQPWIVYPVWIAAVGITLIGLTGLRPRVQLARVKLQAALLLIVLGIGATWALERQLWPRLWDGHVRGEITQMRDPYARKLLAPPLQSLAPAPKQLPRPQTAAPTEETAAPNAAEAARQQLEQLRLSQQK